MLSPHRVSLGAKVLYALLAAGADLRGEAILNPLHLAAKLGVDAAAIGGLAHELGRAGLIKVRHDPAGTDFLSCYFPPNAWQKICPASPLDEKESHAATSSSSIITATVSSPALPSFAVTASRFSKEVCIEFAKARQQTEGKIVNPYALGTTMAKTTDYDEQIALWLQSKETNHDEQEGVA